MKSRSATVLAVLFLLFAVVWFVSHHMRIKRLERETAIQSAKTDFWMRLGNKNASTDSTYTNGDTLFYFRNDSFIGKSVVIIK